MKLNMIRRYDIITHIYKRNDTFKKTAIYLNFELQNNEKWELGQQCVPILSIGSDMYTYIDMYTYTYIYIYIDHSSFYFT